MEDAPRTVRLKIAQSPTGRPEIMLGDLRMESLLASGSLKINWAHLYDGAPGPDYPEVTMTLARGSVDLDIDLEVAEGLVDFVKAREARLDAEAEGSA